MPKEAFKDYNKLIELNSDFVYAYLMQGLIYLKEFNNYQNSKDDLEKVISLEPENSNANFGLVIIYAKIPDIEKSEENLKISAE